MAPSASAEQLKYEKYWSHEIGRRFSPGEEAALEFIDYLRTSGMPCHKVLDAGCGTGRAAIPMLAVDMDVTLLDIAENALDLELRPAVDERFVQGVLWSLPFDDDAFDVVFCCDVLEHLPTEQVAPALAEIARVAPSAYVEWADAPDGTGPLTVGEHVHLTLKPLEWWREAFRQAGYSEIDLGSRGGAYATVAGYPHRVRRVPGGWAWLHRM